MKVRVCSDLHLDWPLTKEQVPNGEPCDVLVIAGDFRTSKDVWDPESIQTKTEKSDQFGWKSSKERVLGYRALTKASVAIAALGNHEYYGTSLIEAQQELLNELIVNDENGHIDSVSVYPLNMQRFEIKDVQFLVCTLWSDTIWAQTHAWKDLKRFPDYRFIYQYMKKDEKGTQTIFSKATPNEIFLQHQMELNWLTAELKSEARKKFRKTVVVTHHTPTYQGMDPVYKYDTLNCCFYNNLDQLIMDHGPDLWIFGHQHNPWRGRIGNTDLICNPRGYPGENEEEGTFDPNLIIEV